MAPLSMYYETIQVNGDKAVDTLIARLEGFPKTGQYPFLIGDDFQRQRAEESLKFNDDDPRDIVESSLSMNVEAWIAEQVALNEELTPSEKLLGPWPGETERKGSIGLHLDHRGCVKPRVFMGLARIAEPWQLPAVMKFGGWNSCSEPAVHCAFHRLWQAEYGAWITGLSNDTIKCLVELPPRDPDAALRLAWQQYWYCNDIVDQGCGTISRLAAQLINSPHWFFWWD